MPSQPSWVTQHLSRRCLLPTYRRHYRSCAGAHASRAEASELSCAPERSLASGTDNPCLLSGEAAVGRGVSRTLQTEAGKFEDQSLHRSCYNPVSCYRSLSAGRSLHLTTDARVGASVGSWRLNTEVTLSHDIKPYIRSTTQTYTDPFRLILTAASETVHPCQTAGPTYTIISNEADVRNRRLTRDSVIIHVLW